MKAFSYKGRILGLSQEETVPTNTTFLFTGNNISVSDDLVRRALRVYIDPEHEAPEERVFGWDARVETTERRRELVSAVLTTVRAYLTAEEYGETDHVADGLVSDLTPAGSFELWDRFVRRPLLWLGCPDPMITQYGLKAEDPDREKSVAIVEAWAALYGESAVEAAQVISDMLWLRNATDGVNLRDGDSGARFASNEPAERKAAARDLDRALEVELESLEANSLGRWLRSHNSSIIAGHRVTRRGTARLAKWQMVVQIRPAC